MGNWKLPRLACILWSSPPVCENFPSSRPWTSALRRNAVQFIWRRQSQIFPLLDKLDKIVFWCSPRYTQVCCTKTCCPVGTCQLEHRRERHILHHRHKPGPHSRRNGTQYLERQIYTILESLWDRDDTFPPKNMWRIPLLSKLLSQRHVLEVNWEETRYIINKLIDSLCVS